jgi:hypothetical protein
VQRTMYHNSFSRDCAPNTNIYDKCRRFLCSACGFSELYILLFWLLMYPINWNYALSNCLLRTNHAVDYRLSAQLVVSETEGRLEKTTQWMLEVSISVWHGQGKGKCNFVQYLYISDLWVASCVVHHVYG